MRIVYVASARMPTEKANGFQIAKMCEAFARAGNDVFLWHPRREQPDAAVAAETVHSYYRLDEAFEVRQLASIDLGTRRRLLAGPLGPVASSIQNVAFAKGVAREARREPPSLWYTRDPWVARVLADLRLRTILEIHLVPRRAGRRPLRALARSGSLARVAALTQPMAEELLEIGFREDLVAVLPDAADLGAFADLPGRAEVRRIHDLPFDRPIVGFVGRFRIMEEEKGIPELVDAAGLLPEIDGRQPLVVAVGGPMEAVPSYLARARASGTAERRLRFVDRVPNSEVPSWIAAFDVAVVAPPPTRLHSRYVSPLKLFEYMAAGAAIVASDLPALRDVLRHGENAWLVRAGDAAALAEGIATLLRDPVLRGHLGSGAAEDARRFTWEGRAARVLEGLT